MPHSNYPTENDLDDFAFIRENERIKRRDRRRHTKMVVDGNDLRNGAMQKNKGKRISYKDYL